MGSIRWADTGRDGTNRNQEQALNCVEIVEEPEDVTPPPQVIFSTHPKRARASDGNVYILKGPAPRVVFAEASAYSLASAVGLCVPPFAICRHPVTGGVWFGSREVAFRLPVEAVVSSSRLVNPSLPEEATVFDVWVANDDRNVNNLVIDRAYEDGRNGYRLCAIDFERAQVLRGDLNRFHVTAVEPKAFRAKEALGRLCRGRPVPEALCGRIMAVPRGDIQAMLERVVWEMNLPEIPWLSAAIDLLEHRGRTLQTLVRDAWYE